MTDNELLAAIIHSNDAGAFAQLVSRYLRIVYAAALRQVGNEALAQDISQAVFLMLWKRAHKVGNPAALAGWLVSSTRLAALAAQRGERRRKKHERFAGQTRAVGSMAGEESRVPESLTLLDAAIGRLDETDRTAVALRYLQGGSVAEVGAALGVSEAAASKRISRAVARLRADFSRHGAEMTAAGVTAAFDNLRLHSPAVPPNLLARTTAITSASPSSAVASIANGVLMAILIKQILAISICVTLLVGLIGGAWWLLKPSPAAASHTVSSERSLTPAAMPPEINAPAQMATPRIEVGVILSYRTATEPSWAGKPYGYGVQMKVLPLLRDPEIEITPIIETGSDTRPGMAAQLQRYFPGHNALDGADPTALGKLNVIVASATWRTTDGMVSSVLAAVKGGVGLINGAGMGVEGPEYAPDHPAVAQIAGLSEGQYGWNNRAVRCRVLASHPILASLAPGSFVTMAPNGAYGILLPGATPLIGLTDPSQAWGAGAQLSNNPEYVFYPLYLSSLGKGRIVGVQFAPYMAMPAALDKRFYIRCVEWLAGRAVR